MTLSLLTFRADRCCRLLLAAPAPGSHAAGCHAGRLLRGRPRRLLRCFRRDRLRVLFVHLRKQATLKFRNGIFCPAGQKAEANTPLSAHGCIVCARVRYGTWAASKQGASVCAMLVGAGLTKCPATPSETCVYRAKASQGRASTHLRRQVRQTDRCEALFVPRYVEVALPFVAVGVQVEWCLLNGLKCFCSLRNTTNVLLQPAFGARHALQRAGRAALAPAARSRRMCGQYHITDKTTRPQHCC